MRPCEGWNCLISIHLSIRAKGEPLSQWREIALAVTPWLRWRHSIMLMTSRYCAMVIGTKTNLRIWTVAFEFGRAFQLAPASTVYWIINYLLVIDYTSISTHKLLALKYSYSDEVLLLPARRISIRRAFHWNSLLKTPVNYIWDKPIQTAPAALMARLQGALEPQPGWLHIAMLDSVPSQATSCRTFIPIPYPKMEPLTAKTWSVLNK